MENTVVKPKKSKKKIIVSAVSLILVAAMGFGIYTLFFVEEPLVALTEQSTFGTLADVLEGSGSTMPADSLSISAASSEAEIEGVYVSRGDEVIAGQLLYIQNDDEVDDLIDEYEAQIETYEDTLDGYYDSLSELSDSISAASIKASFSGKVLDIKVEESDNVQSGSTLAMLIDDSAMSIKLYFDYIYESDIYIGMPASISIADQMLLLDGTVSDISYVNYITPQGAACFAVTVEVQNPGSLTEGMAASAYLNATSGEHIYSTTDGTLEYSQSEGITAETSGTVSKVNVEDYEQVSAGQVLFWLETENLNEQYSETQEKIDETLEKITEVEQKIADAEQSREDFEVYSDISGQVINLSVSEGEVVRSGMAAVTIYDTEVVSITANIDELDIDYISLGMSVTLQYATASQSREYSGTVTEISYEATNQDGVAYFPITIEIDSDGELASGVNVSYSIQIGDTREGVLVPLDALKSTTEGTCVFIEGEPTEQAVTLEDGVVPDGFYAVPVTVSAMNSQYALVEQGVQQDVTLFTRYQQSDPGGGDTTSDSGQSSFEGMMPEGFGGGGTTMPGGGGGGTTMPGRGQ